MLIGLIQMFQQMHNPTLSGPALSVCLLTAFYGHLAQVAVWMP